jgi:hypothetical protein
MHLKQFFKRYRNAGSADRFDFATVAGREDFESLPEFEPIITAARNSDPLPLPESFSEKVLGRITENAAGPERSPVLVQKWSSANSSRELGHCFLVTGFFFFVLSVTFFWGLRSLPEIEWIQWQPAGVMAVALLYGVIGLFLEFDGPTAVRAAEIVTAAAVTVLVVLAAFGVNASQGPFANGVNTFFILVTIGPGLFLAMAVHRYRIGRYRRRPIVAFHPQPAGRSNA